MSKKYDTKELLFYQELNDEQRELVKEHDNSSLFFEYDDIVYNVDNFKYSDMPEYDYMITGSNSIIHIKFLFSDDVDVMEILNE